MRETLRRWIADADTRQSIEDFGLQTHLGQLDYLDNRTLDLYFSLVGELFDLIREGSDDHPGWARLGQALAAVSRDLRESARADALFFSAAAFYCGGYPASAVMTMRQTSPDFWDDEVQTACYEILTRPAQPTSGRVRTIVSVIRNGSLSELDRAVFNAEQDAQNALYVGADEWVARRLYATLLHQFQKTNLRAVLPKGTDARWSPLVESFLDRRQPVWDFFPSQIEAIEAGLLVSSQSYSLQMPTGAGKTALTETLLFSHLIGSPEAKAILLVPYRALARELRYTVGRNLTEMGLRTRTVYGGTVPNIEEGDDLDSVRVIIATPEALTGLLGSHPELVPVISLVVCDEGHLLDSETRGIGLELLLARLRARIPSPRMVFVSAIVPNVEEINAWLGGSESTVVRSEYRPAVAEYAVLRPIGAGQGRTVGLELQELSTSVPAHTLPGFLRRSDFQFTNPATRRLNTYNYDSKKTQAIATARRALSLGTVAVFATEKGGNRGVIGLAEELIKQIDHGLPLPSPLDRVGDSRGIGYAVEYLAQEYGPDWIGTKSLEVGPLSTTAIYPRRLAKSWRN